LVLLLVLNASCSYFKFVKGRLSVGKVVGIRGFEPLFDFRILHCFMPCPSKCPFYFFLTITSCIENQRERKKRAIALKREMPLNAHQSGYRIFERKIRKVIINAK
jgi:hypothetical protein